MSSLNIQDYQIPKEWNSLFKELESGWIIFVIGASDAGKTTFIKFLINEFVKAHKKVAFIDSDIGQSSIGIPTTISSAVISSAEDLKSPRINSLYFVGSTSPPGNLLPMTVGVKRTVDVALKAKPDLIIIDTTGYIKSGAGYELKYQKISLVQPTHVVAIQKARELEPLLNQLSNSFENIKILKLKPASGVKPRSLDERQANRERKFGDYFSNAKELRIPLSQVFLRRGYFGQGNPISELKLYELSKMCGLELLYGEEGEEESVFVTGSTGNSTSLWRKIQPHTKNNFIKVVNQSELEGTLVGLGNKKGDFIEGLGIVAGMGNGSIAIFTPLRDTSKVRLVIFGSLKLNPLGKETGKIVY
ncbi:MAG TPA: Clp1/GlmU family protein [Thermodesulfobacteriota bacterium]|nr:Clp1/GlmU family protein [Thermodesulfobacteriota bacterium]